jgi:hypothetical protein
LHGAVQDRIGGTFGVKRARVLELPDERGMRSGGAGGLGHDRREVYRMRPVVSRSGGFLRTVSAIAMRYGKKPPERALG